MAWIIKRKNNKPFSSNWLFSDEEIERIIASPTDDYVFVNPITQMQKTIKRRKK